MFLDETGLSTRMVRRRGRSPRGLRCRSCAPAGHWATTTFVAALGHGGVRAPMLLRGAMDGAAFLAWVRAFLVPALSPGDVVIADNLSSHKVAGVAEAIEAAGARLAFLPPYSPDQNPIEQLFSKLKALTMKAAARTSEALESAVAAALDAVTPQECRNYLAACGYVST